MRKFRNFLKIRALSFWEETSRTLSWKSIFQFKVRASSFLCLYSPHTQLYPPALYIHFEDAHLHHLSHGHDRQGIFDVAVGQLGDMHQAVLLDAYVDKSSEVHHIA